MRRPRARLRRPAALAIGALCLVGALPGAGLAQSTSPAPEGPPPTPVVVPGGRTSPSPFPQSLRTPEPSVNPPEVRARAAVLADLDTGQVLFSLNATERRPVASLTKIMTALLVLERTHPTEVVTASANAAGEPVAGISGLGLMEGERLRVTDLLYALLLQSANDAAVALAEHVGGTVDGFVAAMNRRAVRLGMDRTSFASPNGLDETGYATARDLVRLTRAAYGRSGFAHIVATRFHTIEGPDAEPRIVQNRNALLWLYPGAIGVKTGFTSAAGFNVVATAEREDLRLVAVVLGEPGEPFSDAAALLSYGYTAFDRRPLIREGRDLGTVDVGGREVQVAAGAGLQGLVPVDAGVRRTIDVLDVAFPPARGEAIGTVTLSVPGRTIGQVPLLVTDVPPPPPLADDGPWWGRAVGSVIDAGAGLLDALFG